MPRATEQQSFEKTNLQEFVYTHARYHGGVAVVPHGKMETCSKQSTVSSLVPFEELPNLPKPIIPYIDLGIEHVDLESLALQLAQ